MVISYLVTGVKGFQGNGCILADDMGLGKTLQVDMSRVYYFK